MSSGNAPSGAEGGIGDHGVVAGSTSENASRDTSDMDAELKALGLWEEDLSEEQKVELLKVVAVSKETAQLEEAVRHCLMPPAWIPSDDTQSHPPPKYMGEEITLDSEEESTPAPPEDQRHPSVWPLHSNTAPYGSGGGEDVYERRNEWDFCSSKPAKLRVLAMEHHLPLQWDEGPPELRDKRFTQLSVSGKKFCSTTHSIKNVEDLHASLRDYQRKLPLRHWGPPLSASRSRHPLSYSGALHSSSESTRRTPSAVTHPKRPHQEEDDAGSEPICLIDDHL